MDFIVTSQVNQGLYVYVFYREHGIEKERLIPVDHYSTSLLELAQYNLPNVQKILFVVGAGTASVIKQ